MLTITLLNGTIIKFNQDDFSDYSFDGNFLFVEKDNVLVGIYNMDYVMAVYLK